MEEELFECEAENDYKPENSFSNHYKAKGLKFNADYSYKRFEFSDTMIIFGVFFIGFIFSLVLQNYYRIKKEKIDEINKHFKGLKGEYEQS